MNKKGITLLRRELKTDNYKMKISSIQSYYIKKDGTILYKDANHFNYLEAEHREMMVGNFKKVLNTDLGKKVFELPIAGDSQAMFSDILNAQSFAEAETAQRKVIERIIDNYNYESDIVVFFSIAEYCQPVKKLNKAEGEESENTLSLFRFVICSINKVEPYKRSLIYRSEESSIGVTPVTDTVINIKSPLEGFLYPSYTDGCADINNILYYSRYAAEHQKRFASNIIGSDIKSTFQEEKEYFEEIVQMVLPDQVNPEKIKELYEELAITQASDEEGSCTINANDIKKVVERVGIGDKDKIEEAFVAVTGDKNFKFNAGSLIPDMNHHSIKIEDPDMSLQIKPNALDKIKQVKNSVGKMCLQIEIGQRVFINGIKLEIDDVEMKRLKVS